MSLLVGVYDMWSVFAVRFTDLSTGVGSLVGEEFSQSPGSRLLVSVLRLGGLFAIQDTFVFTLGNQMNA